jgi:ankyrin repeat protein
MMKSSTPVSEVDLMTIHEAASAGDVSQALTVLTEQRDLVHSRDGHDQTPLHLASSVDVARLLLECGADANAPGWMGETPLHSAASGGRAEIARLLIARGAAVNARRPERDDTPLHFAANEAVANLLIENGAEVDARDIYKRTPLHWAAQFGREGVAACLIRAGADVDARGSTKDTPLHWAAREGHASTLSLLLKRGAHIDVQDRDGHTALHFAAWRARTALIPLLLDCGANPNLEDRYGQTYDRQVK